MTDKPSKAAAAKKFFSSVYVIDATSFELCFLFHVFSKSLSLLWEFFNRHVVFFETIFLKEIRILRYLHSNSAMLILMLMLSSKIKVSYTILIYTLKNFVAELFYDKVFWTPYFMTVHTFLYKWVFFKKTRNVSKACFYIIL